MFYEAPHRLAETLSDAAEILGDRHAVVAREVTKIHEEFLRGIAGRTSRCGARAPPARRDHADDRPGRRWRPPAAVSVSLKHRVEQLETEAGLDRKAALKQAARERGLGKREAYKQLLLER